MMTLIIMMMTAIIKMMMTLKFSISPWPISRPQAEAKYLHGGLWRGCGDNGDMMIIYGDDDDDDDNMMMMMVILNLMLIKMMNGTRTIFLLLHSDQ